MRKKLPTMPAFMTLETLDKAPAYRAAIYDYYAGTSDTVAHGTAGILFDDGSVVVQTYAADPYRLAIRLAGDWYELCPVRRDDPAMLALDGLIHRPDPSKAQLAIEEKHARLRREQQERDDADAHAQTERSRELREAQEAEAERQRRDWIAMHE